MDAYTAQRLGGGTAQIEGVLGRCEGIAYGDALDVGCGAGFETFALASRFERVVAIDSRADFIRKARRIAQERDVGNVTFLAHDALEPLPEPRRFDLVYCNVMSHHVASRCRLLAQLADSVRRGGWLFMAEEVEGVPPMKIEEALERRDDVALRAFSRQVVNALRRRPGFRVFLQGTLEPMLFASGFEVTHVEYASWKSLPHLEQTWARAVAPVRLVSEDPDYLPDQTLDWTITPLLDLADALYPDISITPSLVEKLRQRGPRRIRLAQPDWDRAEACFETLVQRLDGEGAGAASPARS